MSDSDFQSKEFRVEAFGRLVYPKPRAVPSLPAESKKPDNVDAKV